jgi:hypothetical protein
VVIVFGGSKGEPAVEVTRSDGSIARACLVQAATKVATSEPSPNAVTVATVTWIAR